MRLDLYQGSTGENAEKVIYCLLWIGCAIMGALFIRDLL
jgi:hypothetical protein